MSFNLATILRESAKATPDRDVLRFAGGAMTYAQLDAASTRCAASSRGPRSPTTSRTRRRCC